MPASNAAPKSAALASGLAAQIGSLLANTAGLAALELRLAALSLGGILAAALAAVFALMAFWLMLQATLIVVLWRMGLELPWLLLGFTIANGLAVLLLLLLAKRLSRHLLFRNTAAALTGSLHGTDARHSS